MPLQVSTELHILDRHTVWLSLALLAFKVPSSPLYCVVYYR
jgi:hypothetical protein